MGGIFITRRLGLRLQAVPVSGCPAGDRLSRSEAVGSSDPLFLAPSQPAVRQYFGIHDGGGHLSLRNVDDRAHRCLAYFVRKLAAVSTRVRCQYHLVHAQERIVLMWRFVPQDIKGSTCDPLLTQSLDQGRLIHHLSPAGVYQQRIRPHEPQFFFADEMKGALGKRAVNRDIVWPEEPQHGRSASCPRAHIRLSGSLKQSGEGCLLQVPGSSAGGTDRAQERRCFGRRLRPADLELALGRPGYHCRTLTRVPPKTDRSMLTSLPPVTPCAGGPAVGLPADESSATALSRSSTS